MSTLCKTYPPHNIKPLSVNEIMDIIRTICGNYHNFLWSEYEEYLVGDEKISVKVRGLKNLAQQWLGKYRIWWTKNHGEQLEEGVQMKAVPGKKKRIAGVDQMRFYELFKGKENLTAGY